MLPFRLSPAPRLPPKGTPTALVTASPAAPKAAAAISSGADVDEGSEYSARSGVSKRKRFSKGSGIVGA